MKIKENYIVQIYLLAVSVLQWSRASLFTVLCAFSFVIIRNSHISRNDRNLKIKLKSRLSITLIFFALIFPLVQSYIPTYNVLNRLGIIEGRSDAAAGANHTKQARILCQQALMKWTIDNGKIFFGSGAGSEMLIDSGAYQFLSGSDLVRSPHSWFYGAVGRFGIVGLSIWGLIVIINLRKRIDQDFHAIGWACSGFICFISLFGVIIESPFGSLPLAFFLALAGIRSSTYSELPQKK